MRKINFQLKQFYLVLALTVTAFFINTLLSKAQNAGQVSGKIIDAATSQPLIGATVMIEGSSIGTTTDNEGFFKLMNVPTKAV